MSIAQTWFGRVTSTPAQQIRIDLVAGLRLCRARTAIQRLDPHPLHQRLHMPTADLAPIGSQKTAQHPRACEGELHVQPVDLLHESKIGRRYRTRQVIHRAARDTDDFGLFVMLNA